MNTLGIDIGGTKIFVGRYNDNLELEAETTVPTLADEDREATLNNLIQAIEQCRDQITESIGIAWAGFVDVESGTIVKAPNVPNMNNFALCDFVKSKTGLTCTLENDARSFAYGARKEIAPASKQCVGIIIGTGVGCGVISNEKLQHGSGGFRGEIGHQVIEGKEVEAWLAGPGLKEYLGFDSNKPFSEVIEETESSVLIKKLQKPLDVFGQWLHNIIMSEDPDSIILGGGTAQYFWQHFQAEIEAAINVYGQKYPNKFEIKFYTGNNAGALGAAQLSLQK